MSVEKILLIILFIAVSYYPLCGIVGFIRYIRGEGLGGEEMTSKKYCSIEEIMDVVIIAIKEAKTDSKLLKDNEDVIYGIDFAENEILARLEAMGRK